jgi:hypothetical protein
MSQAMTPKWIVRGVSTSIWKVMERTSLGYYKDIATCDDRHTADKIAHAMWATYAIEDNP